MGSAADWRRPLNHDKASTKIADGRDWRMGVFISLDEGGGFLFAKMSAASGCWLIFIGEWHAG
jgi:hypothetical protein